MTNHRTKQVAFIVHTFDTGGIERCVAHLCNHLDRDRFRPLVICLDQNGSAVQWLERDDVDVVEIRKKPSNDLGAIKRLATVLEDRKIDVVHSHNWGTLVETSIARRRANVPVHVHTEHGQGLHNGLGVIKRRLRRWACRWVYQRADAVVVCAKSVRPLIATRCDFPEERILYLANGVGVPSSHGAGHSPIELRRSLGIDENALVIGSVGRLVPVKGFEVLIEATRLLIEQKSNVHCVLVGDGPERDRLRDLVDKAGVSDRVHLVGRQNNVGDWLRLLDVYVNSSHSEAMSMGILEAMAIGRPIVATDVGDNAALVGGDEPCGIIVPVADPNRMAEAIAQLAAQPSRQSELGQVARARYECEFTVEQMAEQHGTLYMRCLQKASCHLSAVVKL